MPKETYNGLHVPDTNDIDMCEVQDTYCNTSKNCVVGSCNKCLFYAPNLNEFTNWFNSNLKNIKDA